MRVTYDPLADALYVRLAKPGAGGSTTVNEVGTIIDLDAAGVPRGFEFLSVRSRGVPTASLPTGAAQAVERFLASGALSSSALVEWTDEEDQGRT
ncbi:MAG: DUF2283 domain-containing protein [Acidimicrobiales bacterium]